MINLLPPQKLSNIRIARNNTVLRRYIELLVGALIIIILALIGSYYYMDQQRENVQLVIDADNAKIVELKPVQDEAERLSETINTIANISSRDVTFSSMLVQIGGLMPAGAVLTGLQFSVEDFSSPLIISAQVDTESKAAILLNNIQSSDLFEKAQIKSISQIETEESTTAPTSTTPTDGTTAPAPTTPEPASPYKFTVVIDAYFAPGAIGGLQ